MIVLTCIPSSILVFMRSTPAALGTQHGRQLCSPKREEIRIIRHSPQNVPHKPGGNIQNMNCVHEKNALSHTSMEKLLWKMTTKNPPKKLTLARVCKHLHTYIHYIHHSQPQLKNQSIGTLLTKYWSKLVK